MRRGSRIRREGYLRLKLGMHRISSLKHWMEASSRCCSKMRQDKASMEAITTISNSLIQTI